MLGDAIYFVLWSILQFIRVCTSWKVVGRKNLPPRHEGGMILATNHIHWLDILALGGSLPFSHRLSWLGKMELFKNPLARWFFTTMRVIPINRGRRDVEALAAAEQALRDGAVLAVYVEGHRSKTGKLQKGRGGAIRTAARAGVPIVPAAITGTEHGLRGLFSRKPVMVEFGVPFHPQVNAESIPADEMERLTTDMMLRIARMLPEEDWGHYQTAMEQARALPDRS